MNRFDQIAHNWDAVPRRLLLAEKTFNAISQKIVINSDMKLLDVGIGTGLLSMYFITKVKHITGIDNSEGMLTMLKEKAQKADVNNIRTVLFDADKQILTGYNFDLVISNMTFHHISNPESFLKQLFQNIKPGGKIGIADIETEDGTFHDDNAAADVKHLGFDKTRFNRWMITAGFINTDVSRIFEIDKNEKKYPVFLAYGEKQN
jgi:ubiquinone/menaquinone biosynthesis C-methylase UbiE